MKNVFSWNGWMRGVAVAFLALNGAVSFADTSDILLSGNWRFMQGNPAGAEAVDFKDAAWQRVSIPHDWAIAGPFDKEIDKQTVAIEQNGEKTATEKTGRTGSLPWIGEGWYRTSFRTQGKQHVELLFDGAMAEPTVYVNGTKVAYHPYGYSSFTVDISQYVAADKENTLAVHLNNRPESSRWYPGAGLYRPVHLILSDESGLEAWGTFVYTSYIKDGVARIATSSSMRPGASNKGDKKRRKLYVRQTILTADGTSVGSVTTESNDSKEARGIIDVKNPQLWSPESPTLYTLKSELIEDDKVLDTQRTTFGIRTVEVGTEGFKLNGEARKIQGVCLHHDLGPLGAAVNKSALARQIKLLKSMGCDAIRTSHNMPSPWQMELCDSLGMMVMAESFDMWKYPKCANGYAIFFDEWWERDLESLVRYHRNHPSIVMWSIGNEIPEQGSATGKKYAVQMQELCHRLDPTRPVTQGLDRGMAPVWSGTLQAMDVPGMNYRTHLYDAVYKEAPQGFILGSETASTISSRGVYKFPVVPTNNVYHEDLQCSSYDMEYCSWSNLPEEDWILQEDRPWTIGEFVWTGFDYLGEPTPYDNYWPSRSSYFGIFDLAGLPKDRYYLYRSHWNKREHTLHLLPHWNWEGHEGDTIPVFCYTDYDTAELFVNGKSMGKRTKTRDSKYDRFRLRWMDVVYEPGELKVVAYNKDGSRAAEETLRTAGTPHHIVLEPDTKVLRANGEDLSFVTVRVVDKAGNECPTANLPLTFKVSGKGAVYKAACNGDATSTESFTQPTMHTFNGEVVVVVSATAQKGTSTLTVSGKGIASGKCSFVTKE